MPSSKLWREQGPVVECARPCKPGADTKGTIWRDATDVQRTPDSRKFRCLVSSISHESVKPDANLPPDSRCMDVLTLACYWGRREDRKTSSCLQRLPVSAAAPHRVSRWRIGGPCSPLMLKQVSGSRTQHFLSAVLCRSLRIKVRALASVTMASPIDLTSSPDEGEHQTSHERGQML